MTARIIRRLLGLQDVDAEGISDGETLVWDAATESFVPGPAGGGGGGGSISVSDGPTTVDPASSILFEAGQSAEIVVADFGGGQAVVSYGFDSEGTQFVHSQAGPPSPLNVFLGPFVYSTTSGTLYGWDGNGYVSVADDLSGVYQPLDTDLTAIAALTTTSFGRGLLTLANQAALLSAAGAAAATHTHAESEITNLTTDLAAKQPLDSDLTAIAALTTTSFGRSLLALADSAALLSTAGAAAASHTHAAADIASGTIAQARLGTGSGGAGTKVLYDDQTYKTPAAGGATDGWTAAGETWAYAAADAPTFTFTVAADVTAKYSAGMRIKLTQTTDKFFIVTAVSTFSGGNTTITVYGGSDYTLANASITNPYWSMLKAPFGFPLSPVKWTQEFVSTAALTQSAPAATTWYNLASLVVPIGVWNTYYECVAYLSDSHAVTQNMRVTLSTANNSESDANWSSQLWQLTNAVDGAMAPMYRANVLTKTTKATHYLNASTTLASRDAMLLYGPFSPTIIRAGCAYL